MKRRVIVVLVIAVVALAGAGLSWYLAAKKRASEIPPIVLQDVKNASLRLDDCLSYEVKQSNSESVQRAREAYEKAQAESKAANNTMISAIERILPTGVAAEKIVPRDILLNPRLIVAVDDAVSAKTPP